MPTEEIIIAIDPGQTTGVVMLGYPSLTPYTIQQYTSTEELLLLVKCHNPEVVVVENFILRSNTALQLAGSVMYSSEVIGALKHVCEQKGVDMVLQPAAYKNMIPDVLLKSTGLWDATKGKQHARDAARHALHYILRHRDATKIKQLLEDDNNGNG